MSAKIPPSSLESERSLLGALLIDKEGVIRVADIVTSDDFYDDNHGIIYWVILELFRKNRPIDIVTVSETLTNLGQLDAIGWNVYLADLTIAVPTSAHVFEYAQIVKAKSVLRKLINTGNLIASFGFDEATEINTLLEKSEQSLFTITQTFIKNKLTHIRDILDLRYEEYAGIHEDPKQIEHSRVMTTFKNLDNKLQGLRGGDLVILAARPSMGKTAMALNIAQQVAKKKNVAIFSLEMSKEQLTDRMVCAAMGIDSWKLQKGELTDEEFARIGDALSELSLARLYIDDSASMNLLEIKSKCRRLKMESGLDLIVIDYLQLINGTNPNNRVQEISDISRGLKSLARELSVPIIALSQLSRNVESRASKEPILSDLRDSGSIEQDADIVLMIYREEYYNTGEIQENDMNKGKTTIFIRKNRNGPIGNADFVFDGKFMKFREIDGTRVGF
jgi:replicative DNA helicase